MKILIVESDDDLREVFEVLLSALGHEVTAVRTGVAVIVIATVLSPDTIFIGERLTDFEGDALARLLRKPPYQSKSFLISFSIYADQWHVAKLKAAGFDGYVGKPFFMENLSVLLECIDDRISAGNFPLPWVADT